MIARTHSNSKDITERTIAAQRGERWQAGFNAYCDGKFCPADPDAKRGWMTANRAQAQAEYSLEEDYEWIRRGGAGGAF